MKNIKVDFTVFTPAFNRANTLHRVFDSLRTQSHRSFEWIVVDDGSMDNTKKIVSYFQGIADFPIRYFYQPNSGKHVAINRGVAMAKGMFFLIADADDAFKPQTLQRFNEIWQSIPENERKNFCGIRVCAEDQYGQRISDPLPEPILDGSMQEAYYRWKFRNESWCIIRTDVHREFSFDESVKGYHPEGIIWKAMTRKYQLRFVDEVLRVYYREDRPDSIMSGVKSLSQKSDTRIIGALDVLQNDHDYFWSFPRFFALKTITLGYYWWLRYKNLSYVYKLPRNMWLFSLFFWPISLCMILYRGVK